ncbi:ABC transporter substrate-binding protein [Marinomonas mediterranea]|jgi:carbohydrate ABC transporter substrate-binding protein, CUT1 family (TC 3.A.1.1.-)|uniref:Probable sugar-binding periplasmic protein n=1 Tax=Marinomonas mediterranea (strain ATCC 700492 / JCM 21426 / NBRC 103028 / MMB-1) TaxID=717774 RepID=F2JZ75_MARM1|nr:ABC transporter substrate-binding protein [Marinomonas mediterranea]ADZ93160.1 extracellular solute-binding protein family 1 [Marinomonas mediterranea MMB-1]WCN11063.1 extracellular solute-binding protein [Marinomonas mediterranea]WCN15123.1 extracellular solute-binding protein [Marinomonas mediterranea]WCN19166.1 extracellular solute-binding protein [Marinomonas mediterranea MMB-1]
MKKQLVLSSLAIILSSGLTQNVLAQDVEVLHWWTSGSEAAALNVLKDDLKSKGYGWQDMPVAGGGGESAMTTLKARVTGGNPPTAAQLLGVAVQDWANEGSLGDLSSVAKADGWDAVVPDAVKDFAINDGKWVAVPVNIHRPNWLWVNATIFKENGLTPPTTWEEFNTVSNTLKAKGITPLAHGGQPWQDLTIFDDVVLGVGGPDFYRKAIHELDMDALGSDTMVKVFDQMRIIRGFVDKDFSGRDWNLATAMLINGKAAMQLMGDWAKGEMTHANVTPGKDILCLPAPSTAGSFLFISDFFAGFDVGANDRDAQGALASSVLSKKFQEEFNLVKGSIPARTDISRTRFDACAQKSMDDLAEAQEKGTLIGSLAHGTAQGASVQSAISDVVTYHFNSDIGSKEAVDILVNAIQDAML